MNRRELLKLGAKVSALALGGGSILGFAGCSVKPLVQTFIDAAQAVYNTNLLPANVQADLGLAIEAANVAMQGWNGTSVNCALSSAAQAIVAIIADIDPGSQLAEVAAVVDAAFAVVASSLLPCTTVTAAAPLHLSRAYAVDNYIGKPAYNAAKSRIQSSHDMPRAIRGAFNDAAKVSGLSARI
jgi:hypothetical protein